MNFVVQRLVALAVPMLVMGSSMEAQAVPNFSGTWSLDAAKSDFGQMPAPSKRVDIIDQKGDLIKIKRSTTAPQGESTTDLTYGTDGKEYTNTIQGNPAKSTGKWDGAVLVLTTVLATPNGEVTVTDHYELSPDGKMLTINRTFASGMGDVQQKIVMAKQ